MGMKLYQSFVRLLIRNYVIGSLIAVCGVGGMFIFSTIDIAKRDGIILGGVMGISLFFMLGIEYFAFQRNQQPILRLFSDEDDVTEDELEAAFLQLHRLPTLSVKRTYGPHFLGFAIPCLTFAVLLIETGVINFPYRYVVIATIGAILVTSMHAMVEFFLTAEAIKPMLDRVRVFAESRDVELRLNGKVRVSIRRQAVLSALLIGILPAVMFGVATDVRLGEAAPELLPYFWQWASIVLVIVILFACLSAWLMARAIQQPIMELESAMQKVKQGNFEVETADSRSDDFARLFAGFNHMVKGLRRRDEMNNQLLESYFSTLAAALDARDPYTAGHSLRVAHYSEQIAIIAGLPPEQVDLLRKSALLHDIGKIGVRDDVLLKDGKLTDEEFAQIKLHPVLGESILKQIQPAAAIAPLLPGVRSHHERYDGRGYPDGLAGEDIPLFGRIIAVADAYDAMTSDRPYRQGMPIRKALSILEEGKGTQWDPIFALLFVEWVRNEERKKEKEKRLQSVQ